MLLPPQAKSLKHHGKTDADFAPALRIFKVRNILRVFPKIAPMLR